MNLNSTRFPNITYEKGTEIFLAPDEANLPFFFDVSDDLTGNDKAMAVVASVLDEVDTMAKTAKAFLKKSLENQGSEHYGIVSYFMEFHRDELDTDVVTELFSIDDPSALSFEKMVDFLRVKRFGSLVDSHLNQQVFIMDLSFDPEVTDELMVVYFDLDKQVVTVTHES